MNADSLDTQGLAGVGVDIDDRAADAYIVGGNVERRMDVGEHGPEDAVFASAEHRIVGSGHAEVGDVGGAVGQHALVGGGDMGMGAKDAADPPVEVPTHRDFFAGGLGMHLDHDDANVGGELLEDLVDLLIRKGVLDAAELPATAREKLTRRRELRGHLKWLADIVGEDKVI